MPANAMVWTKMPAIRKLMYCPDAPPCPPTLMAPPNTKLKSSTNMIGLSVTSSRSSGVRRMWIRLRLIICHVSANQVIGVAWLGAGREDAVLAEAAVALMRAPPRAGARLHRPRPGPRHPDALLLGPGRRHRELVA